MEKKKTRKASKSVKNLSAKSAKRVKGGVSLAYEKIAVEYKPQKPDGSL